MRLDMVTMDYLRALRVDPAAPSNSETGWEREE